MIWSNGRGFDIELPPNPTPIDVRKALHPARLLSVAIVAGVISVIEADTDNYLELHPLTTDRIG